MFYSNCCCKPQFLSYQFRSLVYNFQNVIVLNKKMFVPQRTKVNPFPVLVFNSCFVIFCTLLFIWFGFFTLFPSISLIFFVPLGSEGHVLVLFDYIRAEVFVSRSDATKNTDIMLCSLIIPNTIVAHRLFRTWKTPNTDYSA